MTTVPPFDSHRKGMNYAKSIPSISDPLRETAGQKVLR
jgi:hypothetical protein